MTVIYIDVLFFQNLVIDYLLLLLSGKLAGAQIKRSRIMAGALIGAFYAVVVFLPGMSIAASLPAKLAVSLLMCYAAFGAPSVPRFVRLYLLFFISSVLLAGAVILFAGTGNLADGIPYLNFSLKTLVAAAALCYLLTGVSFKGFFASASKGREIRAITIFFRGASSTVNTLFDTGCEITDPVSGCPVVVCSPDALSPLFSRELLSLFKSGRDAAETFARLGAAAPALGVRFRLIPYRTVSSESGMMLAFRPDRVEGADGKKIGAVVGISASGMPAEKGYQAVLGV